MRVVKTLPLTLELAIGIHCSDVLKWVVFVCVYRTSKSAVASFHCRLIRTRHYAVAPQNHRKSLDVYISCGIEIWIVLLLTQIEAS